MTITKGLANMITGILITDGGPHPAEDWALATAGMLVQAFEVKPGAPRRAQLEIAKDRVRARVAEIMIEHHGHAQETERKLLAAGKTDRLEADLKASEHVEVEEIITAVRAAVQPLLDILNSKDVAPGAFGVGVEDLKFEDHLMRIIRERIEIDLRSIMDVERSWHKNNNPQNAH